MGISERWSGGRRSELKVGMGGVEEWAVLSQRTEEQR